MHWDGWHMGWMWTGWIVVIAAVAAVLWLVMNTSRRNGGPSEDSPEQILKRRYARGEIDSETYERALAELRR